MGKLAYYEDNVEGRERQQQLSKIKGAEKQGAAPYDGGTADRQLGAARSFPSPRCGWSHGTIEQVT
jgi:hypothetical protein